MKLRQVEMLVGQEIRRIDTIREVPIIVQSYDCWRKQYGGMGTDCLGGLKRPQKGGERPRNAVSDLMPDKLILTKAAKGNFYAPLGAGPWAGLLFRYSTDGMTW